MPVTIHTHRSDLLDPTQRGIALGKAWSRQITAACAEYSELFNVVGIEPDVVTRVTQDCREQVLRYAPNLAAEIEGIAVGAQIDPLAAMTLNARTEILAFAPPAEECSATVYWPTDTTPHTLQTWDWRPGVADDVLVHSLPSSPAHRLVTFAEFGQVAKIGVNSRGLGLHFNILKHRSDGEGVGIPVHLAARIVLEQAGTVSEALDVVASLPYGASSVFTFASRDGDLRAACAELSPAGVGVIEGTEGNVLSHTNHFLDQALALAETPALPTNTSRDRLGYLQAHTADLQIADPVARAQALADTPVCVRPLPDTPNHLNVETKATISLDLQAAELGVHCGGPRDVQADTWVSVPA